MSVNKRLEVQETFHNVSWPRRLLCSPRLLCQFHIKSLGLIASCSVIG